MNKILKSFKFLTQTVYFNFAKKAKSNLVPTHRNELKPFSANNFWDNPGSYQLFKGLGVSPKGQEEVWDLEKEKFQEEGIKVTNPDLVEVTSTNL